MYRERTVSAVIPCYNEEEGIAHVIESMPDFVDEIVVVDNNSTDRTAEIATKLGARVIHEKRKGYGAAYKAGIPAAKSDIIVTMDGDGTYPVEEIKDLIDYMFEKDLDFVSGCRFPLKNAEAMHFLNKLGNTILTIEMLILYARGIRDSQSGMWCFKSEVYPKFKMTSDGMPFSEELKIEAILAKDVKFDEYHITYHQRIGEVKLNMWADGFENLFFLAKKRFFR